MLYENRFKSWRERRSEDNGDSFYFPYGSFHRSHSRHDTNSRDSALAHVAEENEECRFGIAGHRSGGLGAYGPVGANGIVKRPRFGPERFI